MIRTLIAKLMGWKVVWLMDRDGETTRRLAHPTPYGWRAIRHGLGIGPVILLPEGKVTGLIYVVSWKEE